jgi:Tol biopolymer transport system component
MRLLRQCVGLLLILVALTIPATPNATTAQTDQRCFEETGFCIEGRIREYWEQNGGLDVFGFPIGEQYAEDIEGQTLQVQWFERNRLELHPENDPPYDVLLGRLGVDVLEAQGRDWQSFPKSGEQSGCQYFAETDQSVCGDILTTWRASGLELDGQPGKRVEENLALFGLPISPLQEEEINGQTLQVQWFERARFELHPENDPPYNVLLGLLGSELHGESAPPAADEPSTPPPDDSIPQQFAAINRIVYNTRGTGSDFLVADIYTINPDGSGKTRLTTDGLSSDPVWSPDGSQIAFVASSNCDNAVCETDIAIMDADGSNVVQLTSSGDNEQPAWSPDGSQIAFVSWREANADIFVMETDGSGVTNLTNHPTDDFDPTWSPDGSQIAFSSNRNHFEEQVMPGFETELFVMNSDGSDVTRLPTDAFNVFGPKYSPDGTHLMFYQMSGDISPMPMYVLQADGSGVTEITSGSKPDWSPDGSEIVFVRPDLSGETPPSGWNLYLANSDGSGETLLTEGNDPDWK